MSERTKFQIHLTPAGVGSEVIADGVAISDYVSQISVVAGASQATRITLTYIAPDMTGEVAGVVTHRCGLCGHEHLEERDI